MEKKSKNLQCALRETANEATRVSKITQQVKSIHQHKVIASGNESFYETFSNCNLGSMIMQI